MYWVAYSSRFYAFSCSSRLVILRVSYSFLFSHVPSLEVYLVLIMNEISFSILVEYPIMKKLTFIILHVLYSDSETLTPGRHSVLYESSVLLRGQRPYWPLVARFHDAVVIPAVSRPDLAAKLPAIHPLKEEVLLKTCLFVILNLRAAIGM